MPGESRALDANVGFPRGERQGLELDFGGRREGRGFLGELGLEPGELFLLLGELRFGASPVAPLARRPGGRACGPGTDWTRARLALPRGELPLGRERAPARSASRTPRAPRLFSPEAGAIIERESRSRSRPAATSSEAASIRRGSAAAPGRDALSEISPRQHSSSVARPQAEARRIQRRGRARSRRETPSRIRFPSPARPQVPRKARTNSSSPNGRYPAARRRSAPKPSREARVDRRSPRGRESTPRSTRARSAYRPRSRKAPRSPPEAAPPAGPRDGRRGSSAARGGAGREET